MNSYHYNYKYMETEQSIKRSNVISLTQLGSHPNSEQKHGKKGMMIHVKYTKKNSQINFKTKMLKSSLSDCTDSYIFVKGNVTVNGVVEDATAKQVDNKINTKL